MSDAKSAQSPGDPHRICLASDLPPGERRIVELEGRSIGVFNVDGEYYALTNVCPHQGGPVCEGTLSGTTDVEGLDGVSRKRDKRILKCPRNGWEFDVTSGEAVFTPHDWRLTTDETERLDGLGGFVYEGADTAGDGSGGLVPAVETHPIAVEDGDVVVYL